MLYKYIFSRLKNKDGKLCPPDFVFASIEKPVEGIKHDNGKPRFDLLDGEFLFDMAAVMTFGATKYADRNYLGLKWTRVFSAGMRHGWSWFIGKEVDEETGKPHIVHAACCFMMLYEMARERKENDDRPKKEYAKNAYRKGVNSEEKYHT